MDTDRDIWCTATGERGTDAAGARHSGLSAAELLRGPGDDFRAWLHLYHILIKEQSVL